jgi:hypothetical protein
LFWQSSSGTIEWIEIEMKNIFIDLTAYKFKFLNPRSCMASWKIEGVSYDVGVSLIDERKKCDRFSNTCIESSFSVPRPIFFSSFKISNMNSIFGSISFVQVEFFGLLEVN